jgi:hypothetical protein
MRRSTASEIQRRSHVQHLGGRLRGRLGAQPGPHGAGAQPHVPAGHAADVHVPDVPHRLRDPVPLPASRHGPRDGNAATESFRNEQRRYAVQFRRRSRHAGRDCNRAPLDRCAHRNAANGRDLCAAAAERAVRVAFRHARSEVRAARAPRARRVRSAGYGCRQARRREARRPIRARRRLCARRETHRRHAVLRQHRALGRGP